MRRRPDAFIPWLSPGAYYGYSNGAFWVKEPQVTYRLGPAPDYAAQESRHGQVFVESRQATGYVLSAFSQDTHLGLTEWSNGTVAELFSGKGLMPWALRPADAWVQVRFNRFWREYGERIEPAHRWLAKRLQPNCFGVLRLLSACPAAVELGHENPALLRLLADRFEPTSARAVEDTPAAGLLRGPRFHLLSFLGLPPERAYWRFLRKIDPAGLSPVALRTVAESFQQPTLRRALRHLPHVPPVLGRFLAKTELWPLVGPGLLADILSAPLRRAESRAEGLTAQLKEIREGRIRAGLPLRPLPCLAQVAAARRAAWEVLFPPESEPDADDFEPEGELPPPPFPGTPDLVPLTTLREVRQEGREQGNCCGGLGIDGFSRARCWYVYRLERPERATVLLERKNESAPWVIQDIRTLYDGIPRFSTVRLVVRLLGVPAQPRWLDEVPVWSDGRHAFPMPDARPGRVSPVPG